MNVLSLFSGIGGLDLGLERAGMTVVGQVEIDPWCRKVLAKHWPEVPRHDDVRTAAGWWLAEPRPVADLLAGGPPCQPVSEAGPRVGQSDPRWLWPDMARVVAGLRPSWVVIENVPGLRTLGLADALGDLRRLGYIAAPGTISACEMGAPHPRKRLFTLAHAEGVRCCPPRPQEDAPVTDADHQPGHAGQHARAHPWSAEPGMGRVADGIPGRVDRLRGLGNAVVPQVAEHIGRLILAAVTP
jgi:DNA (cytosine-5)-methyltransferase 1